MGRLPTEMEEDAQGEFLRILSDTWPDAFIAVRDDNSIAMISPVAQKFLGFLEQASIGQQVHDLLCAESREHYHDPADCPLISKFNSTEKQDGLWKTGAHAYIKIRYRIVDFSAVDCSFRNLIVFQGTSHLTHHLSELKRLSSLSDITPSPMLEINEQGVIQFCNPAMLELIASYDYDEHGIANVLPMDIDKYIIASLRDNKETLNLEKCTDEYSYLWNIHPFVNNGESSALIYGVDIGEQKRLERLQEELSNKIEQEKEKTRREYVMKMVHELRSPLNVISGFSQILLRDKESLPEKSKRLLKEINKGCMRLADQISYSLDMTKIERAQLAADYQSFPLNELITDLGKEFQTLASEKQLSLNIDLPERPISLEADRQLIKQMLINLIANAIKYTQVGSVTVSSRLSGDTTKYCTITVSDTGCGISENDQSTVFELLVRQDQHIKGNEEGSGIGLAFVKDIVALHHGTIKLESVVDEGSNFIVELPLKPVQELESLKLPHTV